MSFFDPASVDLIVKVLDGRGVNNRFWVFFGSLTDVEFWVQVTDTATGAVRAYHNIPGDVRGVSDTAAFLNGAAAASGLTPVQEVRTLSPTAATPTIETPAAVASSACVAGPTALCLDGRFRVEVSWADQRTGKTGSGQAIPRSATTGSFWFFAAANVELVVKVLDGRGVNGRFWVFYGALTDVEMHVKVTDTRTGAVKVYHSLPGKLSGVADTKAF